jgi:hypothetical protein
MDERFDEVTQAFLDHRDFTTFCFDKVHGELRELRRDLRHAIKESEGRLSHRIDSVSHRLDRHELVLSEILNEVKAISRR